VDAYADATILVGVDSKVLGGLYLDQLTPGCISSSVEALNLTSKKFGAASWSCQCDEHITSDPKHGSVFVCNAQISKGACGSSSSSSSFLSNQKQIPSVSNIPSYDMISSFSNYMEYDMQPVMQRAVDEAFGSIHELIATEAFNLLTTSLESTSTPSSSSTTKYGISLPTIPTIPPLMSLIGRHNCSAHVPDSHGSPPESYVNFMAEGTLWSKVCVYLFID
jgi:hypothetical protein